MMRRLSYTFHTKDMFPSLCLNLRNGYMRTAENFCGTHDEWIELKNISGSDIRLDGWTLRAEDGTPDIRLSGTVRGGGYFLLERTDDSTMPSVPADQIYAGALSNSGEQLELKDSGGVLIHSVLAKSGWPAGDNTTKNTMQWSDNPSAGPDGTVGAGGWIIAFPAPHAPKRPPPHIQQS